MKKLNLNLKLQPKSLKRKSKKKRKKKNPCIKRKGNNQSKRNRLNL